MILTTSVTSFLIFIMELSLAQMPGTILLYKCKYPEGRKNKVSKDRDLYAFPKILSTEI